MHTAPKRLHETLLPPVGSRVQLVAAGRYRAAQGQDYPAHRHPTLELIVYQEGSIVCLLDGEQAVETRPGTVLVIPAGQVHADRATTRYAQLYLQLRHPGLERTYTAPRVLNDEGGPLGAVAALIVREWSGTLPERERMLELLLGQLELVLHRLDTRETPADAERLVRRAEGLLSANLTTRFSVHDLADELGVAPSTLRGHFARLRGRSPKAYLLELRLRRAVELIRTSSLSLDEIAHLTGYYSASHLSRHVKQATGRTPGACRTAAL